MMPTFLMATMNVHFFLFFGVKSKEVDLLLSYPITLENCTRQLCGYDCYGPMIFLAG